MRLIPLHVAAQFKPKPIASAVWFPPLQVREGWGTRSLDIWKENKAGPPAPRLSPPLSSFEKATSRKAREEAHPRLSFSRQP